MLAELICSNMIWCLFVLFHHTSSLPVDKMEDPLIGKVTKYAPPQVGQAGGDRDSRAALPKPNTGTSDKSFLNYESSVKAFEKFMLAHPDYCPNITLVYNSKALSGLMDGVLRHCSLIEYLYKTSDRPGGGLDPVKMSSREMQDGATLIYEYIEDQRQVALLNCSGSDHGIMDLMYPGFVSIGLYCIVRLILWMTTPWRRSVQCAPEMI
jgi:hypothetical protein